MTVATNKSRVAAYVPSELKEKAEAIARTQKRSLSNLIELLLDDCVKKHETSQSDD